MGKWIPERPPYRRERRMAGYPLLAVFSLFFVFRLLCERGTLLAGRPELTLLLKLLLFALPVLLYFSLRRRFFPIAIRLRAPSPSAFPLLLFALLFALSATTLLSVAFGGQSTLGNGFGAFNDFSGKSFWRQAFYLVAGALLPAFLSPFFFIGTLCGEYERRGVLRALILPAVSFALFPFDPANFPAYLLLGFLLALLFYATDSLPAVIGFYGAYNLFLLFGGRYLTALFAFTGSPEILFFFSMLLALSSGFFFCRSAIRIYRERSEDEWPDPRRHVPFAVQFYTFLDALTDPAVLLSWALAVAAFILL